MREGLGRGVEREGEREGESERQRGRLRERERERERELKRERGERERGERESAMSKWLPVISNTGKKKCNWRIRCSTKSDVDPLAPVH